MALWTSPTTPLTQRVQEVHQQAFGVPDQCVATAPATWMVIGEHIDHFGGIVIAGLADLEAAAAISPRTDGVVAVHIVEPHGTAIAQVSLDELAQRAAAQQPTVDEEGQPVIPPAPDGDIRIRVAGMVWMLINRQLLSRETAGMNIAVVSDIPAHAGLGAHSAIDVAVALALVGQAEDAPMRARLAEVCSQAVTVFSLVPPLRARHTAALRGSDDAVAIIDYSDNSVTQAPHPFGRDMVGFALAVPGEADISSAVASIVQRQRFVQDACHAFGTESLRALPDASQRVLDWLSAVHDVHGPEGRPTIGEASDWLRFYEEETQRAATMARVLRSRRGAALFQALQESQRDVELVYGMDAAAQLAELARLRGVAGVRAAAAGTAHAVIAYVPAAQAESFAADTAADGLDVIPLRPGTIAEASN
ncbi:galactokinase [Corynebacterium lizhenjunii]|uniref:Galactokinase n=1 Tax=Corynebacterium lizhenjunii TaxID=2709394 RepID=A0A7T0KF52_9CORY|nr:galactokinase family protein [Corynebacterium lizhenjunii]QPK78558.1 galactokinase [Corynebacterium lizhenjunii]